MEPEAERGGETWNFRVLLSQGVFFDIAQQVASPKLVLPFLYIALGAPVLFAGLLVPIVQVGNLVAQMAAAPSLRAARLCKWYMVLACFAVAAALAIIGVAAGKASTAWLAAIFLLVATILGLAQGLNYLAFQDLMGRVLRPPQRSALLFTQTGLAGLLAIVIAWASQHYIDSGGALQEHLELVWAGVGVMLLSSLTCIIIREPARSPESKQAAARKGTAKSRTAELRESFGAAAKLDWMRRFIVARMLFMSIELATPFYAIHAASLHAGHLHGLRSFVIGSSAGLVVGAVLWQRVSQASIRTVLILASAAAVAAGALALVGMLMPSLQTLSTYAGVFVLVALANQGISNARKVYVVGLASPDERAYCIAVSNFVGGAFGMALAFVFGVIAHLQGVTWPIWFIIALNVAAALYSFRLRDSRVAVEGAM